MENSLFNVVVAYNEQSKTPNVRYWTSFKTEEEYLANKDSFGEHETVIATGLTDTQAIGLCMNTPLEVQVDACYAEAIDPRTGDVDSLILRAGLTALAMMRMPLPLRLHER